MSNEAATSLPLPGEGARVLDLEDMARVLIAFLAPRLSPAQDDRRWHTARRGSQQPAYRFDEESGMVYILD